MKCGADKIVIVEILIEMNLLSFRQLYHAFRCIYATTIFFRIRSQIYAFFFLFANIRLKFE